MVKNFATQRFLSLLVVGTLSMLIEYLILLSDNIIAGNLLGVSALSAITLLMPFFSFIVFVGILISIGTTVIISFEVGRGQREEANRYFGQGIILEIIAGVLLTSALLLVFYSGNLISFDVSPEVNGYVREYFKYMCYLPLVMPINSLLYCVLMVEGKERLCAVASIVSVISNIGLSIFLCGKMGIGGISLATVLSNVLQLLIFLSYFVGKKATLRFVPHFRVRDTARVIKYSLNDAATYLFLSLMQLTMNMFLLQRFGESAIAVFAVVMNIIVLLNTSFDGIGQSILPLISVYRGEGSQKSIGKTMRTANITALVEGTVVSLVLIAFANLLPRVFGIVEPELLRQTAAAIRIYCTAAVFFAFIMLYSSYYLYIGEIRLAMGITMSYLFVAPVTMGIVSGLLMGQDGVWVGMAFSSAVTGVLVALYIKKQFPEKTFPLLLDQERLDRELSYDVPKTKEGVMALVYSLERDLSEKGVERSKVLKIMLMVEETQMLALEADEKNRAMIECSVLIDDVITVILRDSGKHSDFTVGAASVGEISMDNISMNTISKRIVANHKEKQYIMTGGRNRIIMQF